MSIVSVIGHKMRNMVGINGKLPWCFLSLPRYNTQKHTGQIFSNLASGGVNVYFVSQGASEINVSFVVPDLLENLLLIHGT
jgi:aspartate kinase